MTRILFVSILGIVLSILCLYTPIVEGITGYENKPLHRYYTASNNHIIRADDTSEPVAVMGSRHRSTNHLSDIRCPCPMVNGRCDCKMSTFTSHAPIPANTLYARSRTHEGETLIFEDNFDDFDLRTWKHEISMGGMGNWEFQIYMNNRTNSYVKDGKLFIRPTLTSDRIGEAAVLNNHYEDIWGFDPASECTANAFFGCARSSGADGNILNPLQSARLRTAESVSIKYGRVEVKAKLPNGDWLWPAIWMMPRDNMYGTWPSSGEIDIMESRGNAPGYIDGGRDVVSSTLHWGPSWQMNRYNLTDASVKHNSTPSKTFADEFHIYGLYWDEKELYTYIDNDDNKILHVRFDQPFFEKGEFTKYRGMKNPWETSENQLIAPFDEEFYLIINLAVGGTTFFKTDHAGKPWRNKSKNAMTEFYNAKNSWYKTWCTPDNKDGCTLQIDSVHIWTLDK